MEREIKFRAHIKATGKIYNVASVGFDKKWVTVITEAGLRTFSFKKIDLMQYTGLRDRNGMEIYEGYVIAHPYRGRHIAHRIMKWTKYDGYEVPGNLETAGSPWEVVGNIFENPELREEILNES